MNINSSYRVKTILISHKNTKSNLLKKKTKIHLSSGKKRKFICLMRSHLPIWVLFKESSIVVVFFLKTMFMRKLIFDFSFTFKILRQTQKEVFFKEPILIHAIRSLDTIFFIKFTINVLRLNIPSES